ncbi:pirin family protein [Chitinophagaceae bacterium LB-8]|uniref:Pirin family protein n=1 Tax=Paraflavisolibacter caeni TaxID=2982496 RepID=A0A9X2XN26_9BACT|nr:pirin-like C-terminal cupin domain-containing protein [Paraflavisolibacter caeni]MCU7547604.1 pirin family protein [Paraflavisolibacter caeni]
MQKKIDHLLEGRKKSIGEETILQSLPHKDFRFASPFIVLHHLPPHLYPAGSPPERIHPHPHRGFAPVTFMFQGEGYHNDTNGYNGVLKSGEVQWMFAGKGLLHSEGPTKKLLEKGGNYEFVQLWVNVPAKYKMESPYYQQAKKDDMPLLFQEEGIDLRLASGSYDHLNGPIRTFTPVMSAFGTVKGEKSFQLKAIEGYWTLLYVLDGTIVVNNEMEVSGHHLLVFSKEGTEIQIQTRTDAKLLYLSAEPIEEPVAAKGNFVMNTQEEIEQAEKDFAERKFGTLDF